MPAALPFIAVGASVIGAGAAVVGTVNSAKAANRANEASKQQYAYTRQIQQNRSVRERRDAIRAARIGQANLAQNAENSGGSLTSAALGTQGSIQSQLNSNLSFLDTQTSLADKAGAASQVRANAESDQQKWGAISSLGMAVFSTASSKIKVK